MGAKGKQLEVLKKRIVALEGQVDRDKHRKRQRVVPHDEAARKKRRKTPKAKGAVRTRKRIASDSGNGDTAQQDDEEEEEEDGAITADSDYDSSIDGRDSSDEEKEAELGPTTKGAEPGMVRICFALRCT